MKKNKLNHEIFYTKFLIKKITPNFYFKKVTPYSELNTGKSKFYTK